MKSSFNKNNSFLQDPSQIVPDRLYLGDWNHAQNIDRLNDLNISWVFTIHNQPENLKLPKEIKHKQVVCPDISSADISKYFDQCYRFVEEANERGSACLIHCGAGVSRSSTLVIAYLMRKLQWSAQVAFDFVRERRSLAAPNDGFWRTLCALEKPLGISNRSDPNASFGGKGEDAPKLSEEALGQKPQLRIIAQEYYEDDQEDNEKEENERDQGRKRQRQSTHDQNSSKKKQKTDMSTSHPFVMDVLKDGKIINQIKIQDLQPHQRFFVGRTPGSDLYLQHESISRRHAYIQRNGAGDITITDLKSAHGTNLDGVWIRSNQDKRIVVGSKLKFGGSTREYRVLKT
eukprot:TRINITY_DN100257_c0_g1_i7.p1 TRINITY_DN100257_c0_g1~~TRINITY_DN100257_c0_g1_i7.p1  ORF type:complete len:354 (+),score=35.73 TRINITY_DN100257_c0_g1_i7:28-1062(+)